MEKLLLDYGLPGGCILALAGYIMYLHKLWKEDRDSLKNVTENSTEAIKGNTSVLAGLTTILHSIERRIK